jgi:hypothetical protein
MAIPYVPRPPNWGPPLMGPPAPTANTGGGGRGGGGRGGGGGFGGGAGWWNPFRNATFQGRALFPRQNVAYQQNQANQVQNAFGDATVTPYPPPMQEAGGPEGFHGADYWRNYYGPGGAGAAQPTAPTFPDRDMADRGPMAPKGGNPVNDMMALINLVGRRQRGRGEVPMWDPNYVQDLLRRGNPRTEKRVVR